MKVLEGVDRALRVVAALGDAGATGVQLGELAAAVDLDKPVVHRILTTLRARGYAVQDGETGSYALGPAFLAVTDRYLSQDNLRGLLHGAAFDISLALNELVHVGVPEQQGIRLIDKVEPRHALRVWSQIGDVFNYADSPLGTAIMAVDLRSRDDVAALFGRTTHSVDDVWARVEQARKRGWAEHADADAETASVAVAITRGTQAVAAVSVTMPLSRLANGSGRSAERIAAMIRDALEQHLPPGLACVTGHDRVT